jgi:hypothetical protein
MRNRTIFSPGSLYGRKIFIFTEPLRGWSCGHARKTRTALDWAEEIKYLLTECYPDNRLTITALQSSTGWPYSV